MKLAAFLTFLTVCPGFNAVITSEVVYFDDEEDIDRRVTGMPARTTDKPYLPEITTEDHLPDQTTTIGYNFDPSYTTTHNHNGNFDWWQYIWNIQVSPKYVYARYGERLIFKCISQWNGQTRFPARFCPRWIQVNDILHSHHENITLQRCTVTLEIEHVNSRTPQNFICSDGVALYTARAYIKYLRSNFNGNCEEHQDCTLPFTCNNSKCICPESRPVYIANSKEKCFPVRQLFHPCSYSAQCISSDIYSYCHSHASMNSSTEGICVCDPSFPEEGGKCRGYTYVYIFSKRYRTVFFVLLSLSIVLIMLGLLRLCMRQKHVVTIPGHVILSSNSPEVVQMTEPEQKREKERF